MGNSNKFGILVLLKILLLASNSLKTVNSARILVYGAIGTHSTRISMFPLMEALVEKGHQVTYLSAYDNFEDPNSKSGIEYFTPPEWKKAMGPWEDHFSFFEIRKQGLTPELYFGIHDMGINTCQILYSDPEFVNFVKTSKFDLVIMEASLNDCALGLVHVFGAKLVIYATSTPLPWFSDSYGLPDETSTLPEVMWDFPAGDQMSFWERTKNALSPIYFSIIRDYSYFPKLEEITKKGLGLDKIPSFREIERNLSLLLVTTHFSIDLPRSLPPHVIPIGGAVAGSKKIKPLSKDVEEYINSAKNGFIYISFGTVAEFTNFALEVQTEFIQALGSFPETKFLWKISEDIKEPLPKNVMVTKWVPQQTVLAHKNIKAYVTHCGMGSTAELVHFGVPAILIPVLADQDIISKALDRRGVGVKLEITTLKKHELEHAISEILTNAKYRNAMKELSDAFKDRPSQPVESAVWWIEYVMRHENSNDYLIPLSIRQPWWKRRQIDIWLAVGAALAAIVTVSIAILYCLMKTIVKKTVSKKGKGGKLKSN